MDTQAELKVIHALLKNLDPEEKQDNYRLIKRLTLFLNQCRDKYYNESRPEISDSEYDELFDELARLENKYNFYYRNSPTKTVGYVVNSSLPKVKHDHPLLSLDKTKSYDEAEHFTKDEDALLMFKLDGLTVCLTYDNGELVEASTRGNGEEGSLITDNVRTFINVPEHIDCKWHLKITGEAIIHKNDFEQINKQLPENERYKTPRNLASGSVQLLDSSICATRKLYFYAFNVIEGLDMCRNLDDRLAFVSYFGIDTCPFEILEGKYSKMMYEFNLEIPFADTVANLVAEADSMSIPIDGLVVMYRDLDYGAKLGRTKHHYKNGLALKFQEEEEETIIRNIQWQVGRTGKITPVAIFDPVILDNTTVSAASLHNINILEQLGIRKNATVTVVKKNEIIPQIIKSEGGDKEFEYPKVCPICGDRVEIKTSDDTTSFYCTNDDCVAKNIRNLTYFCSKECMNIDGLSEKTIERFVNAGLLSSYADIYDLVCDKEEIISFDGMGEKMYDSLVTAIEKSKDVKLENFITALSIPNVGLSKAKLISRHFNGSWDDFRSAVLSGYDFDVIEGLGKEINNSIHRFFKTKFNPDTEYDRLVGMMRFVEPENHHNNKLEGKTFVVTGNLEHYSNRKELQDEIEGLGGKVTGSVSKKTSYLINNDIESSSSKNQNAKKYGVPIITEDDFLKLINKQ